RPRAGLARPAHRGGRRAGRRTVRRPRRGLGGRAAWATAYAGQIPGGTGRFLPWVGAVLRRGARARGRRGRAVLRRVRGARGGPRPARCVRAHKAVGVRPARRAAADPPSDARTSREPPPMSRYAHPAGPRHADVLPEEHPPAPPEDLHELDPRVWPGSAQRVDGELALGGVGAAALAAEYGTPLFVLDEAEFRRRARDYKEAFGGIGADVYYAGKALLTKAVAKWVHEEGLKLDVCSGGELSVRSEERRVGKECRARLAQDRLRR